MAAVIAQFFAVLYGFYNTLFEPVLALGPYPSLIFFSAVLAGVFSIIYWFLLDIEKNKDLKEKISDHQEKMKEARKNDETDKASEHMQKTMKMNQKMMMLNFKPMIATMVFVALIFPWLGNTFAPGVELHRVDNATYRGNFTFGSQSTQITVENASQPILAYQGEQYRIGDKVKAYGIDWTFAHFGDNTGGLFSSGGEGKVAKMNAVFMPLPFSIPFAGNELNWLGFYIIIAMPLTYIFRKMLGVQ